MSLQVWLPLNGDIKNQGLSGYEMSVSTSPSYTDNGKIGRAISTGAFYLKGNQIDKIFNNSELSISFWLYPHSNTNSGILFGNEAHNANGGRQFSIFLYPTVNDLHLSWQNGANTDTFIVKVWEGVFPSNQWTHCCITYRNPNGSIYINGVLAYTFSGVSNSSSFTYDTMILNNASNRYVNDLRIYNHCLSAKEVKEISKGLICHYKLSSLYETGRGNKYGGTVASGAMRYIDSKFTMTALENERGYNYKFTYTGNGDNSWPSMNAGNYSFTAGKRYYYSCKVRCHSANFSMQLRASRSDNDWVTNMTDVISSSLADGKWHEYVVSQVVNSTYDRAGTTVTCNPVLEFYTESLSTSGKVYSADFDMKDVQVIESDWYVPFTDGFMANAEVTDCSGLGNSGIAVGNIAYKNSSVRYEGCYDFDGDTGCIQIPNLSTLVPSGEFTMNCWIYHDDTWSSKEYETIFGGPDNFELEAKKKSTNSPVLCAWSWGQGTAAYELNKWNMITMTRNASETKFYINGELKITGSAGTIPSGNYFIGAWKTSSQQNYKGKISDFRLYSVVLSEEDIKTLYNISASVDKNGNMYAYEFKEE